MSFEGTLVQDGVEDVIHRLILGVPSKVMNPHEKGGTPYYQVISYESTSGLLIRGSHSSLIGSCGGPKSAHVPPSSCDCANDL